MWLSWWDPCKRRVAILFLFCSKTFKFLSFQFFFPFSYYHWIDTSAGGLSVPDGIIRVTLQHWNGFIRYISLLKITYLLLKLRNSYRWHRWHDFGYSALDLLVCFAPKPFILFGFPIFWSWAYLMKDIPEIWYLRFFLNFIWCVRSNVHFRLIVSTWNNLLLQLLVILIWRLVVKGLCWRIRC